ncbi:MAG: hypothetical protein V4525_11075 [Pseudomonadota bacterium]
MNKVMLENKIIRMIYQSKGKWIKKGTYGFPNNDNDFKTWVHIAHTLLTNGLLLQVETQAKNGSVEIRAYVGAKGIVRSEAKTVGLWLVFRDV